MHGPEHVAWQLSQLAVQLQLQLVALRRGLHCLSMCGAWSAAAAAGIHLLQLLIVHRHIHSGVAD
jgi:hypothetical protein